MANLKIFAEMVEPEALNQIYTFAKHPAFENVKVRIMPDTHAGKGCVIGFTAEMNDKVIPNVVGVDISCGMLTVGLGDIEIDFEKLDAVIREKVPSGRNVQEEESDLAGELIEQLRCKEKLQKVYWLKQSLGTLGGGNHFVEIDRDEDNNKYLIIHTGSRNLGKQVAEIYQDMAIQDGQGMAKYEEARKKLIEKYKRLGHQKDISRGLKQLEHSWQPDKLNFPKNLCYVSGCHLDDYLHDVAICAKFAWENREKIARNIMESMGWKEDNLHFHTVHNYIDLERKIIRKGAISAENGEQVLIPLNMRDGCILGVGKGNPDWNYSAPHGAGRLLSRHAAKEVISLEDYQKSMEGIYTTSVNMSTIDESPFAYKSMSEIVDTIGDSVEIQKILKPIYNFKAGE